METSVQRKTERELEVELGDDYIVDLQKNYDLPEDQKYDVIPETWQGHNIADFVDPDIMEKLEALEKEEFEELGVHGLEVDNPAAHFNRARSTSKVRPAKRLKTGEDPHRSQSVQPRSQSGMRDPKQSKKLDKLKKKADKKTFASQGKAGESDRRIQEKKPKHLFAGKRGLGKTDRR